MTTSAPSCVRIVCVLPSLLGTYGDDGNAVVLERRLAWRGITAEVVRTTTADPLPRSGDLYVLGGGEDWAQEIALQVLEMHRCSWLLDGPAPVLAVCAGLQLLGAELTDPDGRPRRGLGLTDIRTTRGSERAVGEVVARTDLGIGDGLLTGFANHAGVTTLGPGVGPLGWVQHGPGNAGHADRAEGALDRALVGSYLHGPLLARNPALADHLLSRAVGGELAELPPGPEQSLHDERVQASTRHPAHAPQR